VGIPTADRVRLSSPADGAGAGGKGSEPRNPIYHACQIQFASQKSPNPFPLLALHECMYISVWRKIFCSPIVRFKIRLLFAARNAADSPLFLHRLNIQ